MPYKNLPKSKWGQMEECVKSVMAKKDFKPYAGKTKVESAHAVCYVSINKKHNAKNNK